MNYDVSVGLVIGAALSKKGGRITEDDFANVVTSIRKNASRYYVDFSRDSIYSEIDANCDYFTLENGEIFLNASCADKMVRVKRYFYDVLDEDIRHAIDLAFVNA